MLKRLARMTPYYKRSSAARRLLAPVRSDLSPDDLTRSDTMFAARPCLVSGLGGLSCHSCARVTAA